MERKGIGVILMAVCLVFAFSVMPAEAQPTEDTVKKCNDGRDNDRNGLTDGEDPSCEGLTGGGGGGEPTGGDSERLTVWFQGGGGYNLQSDGAGSPTHPNCFGHVLECYSDHEEKVRGDTGGLTQPNPAGIRLVPNHNGKGPRGITLDLDLDDCQDVVTDGCDVILPSVLKDGVTPLTPNGVTAWANSHSDDPQLILATAPPTTKNYHFAIAVRLDSEYWIIEAASTVSPTGNMLRGAVCGETGHDVTVTGLEDTDNDGFSNKWRVTAVPVDSMTGNPSHNARVCADLDDDGVFDLVARVKMTFEYTAQTK